MENKPYVFKPSSFYVAQCPLRLRLDQLSTFYPSDITFSRTTESEEAKARSAKNMKNGNDFEAAVIKLLGVSKSTCSCSFNKRGTEGICPGTRAFQEAVREAAKSLEDRPGTGTWYCALAQLHIEPPPDLLGSLGQHVTLSKSFADLVLVGTRGGRVVIEVVDMKYSAEAKSYHKQQVACYIVYLAKGPMRVLLKDVEWQGSIWLPRQHTERASGAANTTTVLSSTPSFTFESLDDAVLRQPITDLGTYVDSVMCFFSTTLTRSVGDRWPLWQAAPVRRDGAVSDAVPTEGRCTTREEAIKRSWADIEDMGWAYTATLCGYCPHRAICDVQRDAELTRRLRDLTRLAVRPCPSRMLPDSVLPCTLSSESSWSRSALTWSPFFALSLTRSPGATQVGALPLPDLSSHREALLTWMHAQCVCLCDGGSADRQEYNLDLGEDCLSLMKELDARAKKGENCVVMDGTTKRGLQIILFLLSEKSTYSPYWLENPENAWLPRNACEVEVSEEHDSFYEPPPKLNAHVYVFSEMLSDLFELPWAGAALTARTLHAFIAGVDENKLPSHASAVIFSSDAHALFEALGCLLHVLNRKRSEGAAWLPPPSFSSALSVGNALKMPCPGAAMQPSDWRHLMALLITFTSRRQETDLSRSVLRSGLAVDCEGDKVVWRPKNGQDAVVFVQQLGALILFTESVQSTAKDAQKDSHCYQFQLLQSSHSLKICPSKDEQGALQLKVERHDLQEYLAHLECGGVGSVAPLESSVLGGKLNPKEPVVVIPVVEDRATCVCYKILRQFLAATVTVGAPSNLVFLPYFNGEWPTRVKNTLAGIDSKLLESASTDIPINEEQRHAVKNVYNGNSLTMIWGPPGTGKTATLAHIISDLFLSTSGPLKVLVIANTNQALNVLYAKLEEKRKSSSAFDDCLWLCLADAKDSDTKAKTKAPKAVPVGKTERLLVLCTVFKSYTQLLKKGHNNFDVLIVDEGSMMPAMNAALSGQLLNPSCHKLIVAGDLLQLQPIQEEYGQNQLFTHMYSGQRHWMSSLLQALFGPPGEPSRQLVDLFDLSCFCQGGTLPPHVVQLNVCFRSRPRIVSLFSDLYPKALECGHKNSRADGEQGCIQHTIVPQTGDEVRTVLRVVACCQEHAARSILVVTAHRRQRYMITRAIQSEPKGSFPHVHVDTTERTQGSEADVVILCYGPGVRVDSDFGYHLFRMNVALSRAISRVVLVLDETKRRLLRETPEGLAPFVSMTDNGKDVSPSMTLTGWRLLTRTFNESQELVLE